MKIALVGSAPSSINKAPYGDPDWEIWGCSPGAYGIAGPKSQAWFELHRWEPQVPGHAGTGQPWFTPEYCEFLIRHPGTVYMAEPIPPEFTNAKTLPIDRIVDEFGPFFLNSSLSWMWALAILKIEDDRASRKEDADDEVAMFGVDMAAHEEYATQRPGCQFFITEAMRRGIKVTVPPESDILQPSFWYGVTENKPMAIKLTARLRELEGRKAAADQRLNQAQQESVFLSGAIDDVKYMLDTWVTHQSWLDTEITPTGNEERLSSIIPDDANATLIKTTQEAEKKHEEEKKYSAENEKHLTKLGYIMGRIDRIVDNSISNKKPQPLEKEKVCLDCLTPYTPTEEAPNCPICEYDLKHPMTMREIMEDEETRPG